MNEPIDEHLTRAPLRSAERTRPESLSEEPLIPTNYWKRIGLVVLAGAILTVGGVASLLRENHDPRSPDKRVAPLLGAVLLVGIPFGFLLYKKLERQTTTLNQGMVTHGQIGFRCRHAV